MSEKSESERDAEVVAAFLARRPSEDEYLRKVEALAQAVSHAGFEERGAAIWRIEEAETPLQRAIAELCLNLRGEPHYEGDGCLDD